MCVIASRMMPGHACVCIHEKKDPYFLNIRKKVSDDDDDGAVKMGEKIPLFCVGIVDNNHNNSCCPTIVRER